VTWHRWRFCCCAAPHDDGSVVHHDEELPCCKARYLQEPTARGDHRQGEKIDKGGKRRENPPRAKERRAVGSRRRPARRSTYSVSMSAAAGGAEGEPPRDRLARGRRSIDRKRRLARRIRWTIYSGSCLKSLPATPASESTPHPVTCGPTRRDPLPSPLVSGCDAGRADSALEVFFSLHLI
jgi:hypothetical protein